MNLSAPFIRRPKATWLLAAALLLAGAAAFTQLAVSPLPKVDFPTINVSASLPGASPTTMATAVAMPLERRFGRIAGVSEITSQSALGTTNVTVQFDMDRDVEGAARDIQAAINAAGGDLPPNLRSSGIATEVAMVSGLAPGRFALTLIVGKSTLGSGDTGSWVNAAAPASRSAAASSDVAFGRWMNGADRFTARAPCAGGACARAGARCGP